VPPPALGGRTYAGPPLELSFWNGFTGGDGPHMRRLVEAFNASHPRIRVRMSALRWDDFYRKVPVAVAAGKGPDVGVLQQHRLPAAAALGVVVPLDALLAELGVAGGDFHPGAWAGGAHRGAHYGLPLDVHPLAMYFNRGAFARAGIREPPETAEALEEALGRLRHAGFRHPFWVPTLWPAHFMFASLLWQFGGEPFGEDGRKATFASGAGVQAASFLRRLVREGHSPPAVALDAQWNAFGNGTNAIAWDGIWMMHNVASVPGGAGVAPLPRIGPTPAVWANAHHLVVFNRPRLEAHRVQAGAVFLAWLSEHSLAWAEAGQLPARTAVRESPAFAALPVPSALARQLPHVRMLPSAPGLGELQDDTLLYAVDAALRTDAPGPVLARAARLADDHLAALARQYGEG
jgi:multiple sugar transport system substrate-binding protein